MLVFSCVLKFYADSIMYHLLAAAAAAAAAATAAAGAIHDDAGQTEYAGTRRRAHEPRSWCIWTRPVTFRRPFRVNLLPPPTHNFLGEGVGAVTEVDVGECC